LEVHESERGSKEDDDAAENSPEATGNVEEESPQYEIVHEEFPVAVARKNAFLFEKFPLPLNEPSPEVLKILAQSEESVFHMRAFLLET